MQLTLDLPGLPDPEQVRVVRYGDAAIISYEDGAGRHESVRVRRCRHGHFSNCGACLRAVA